MAAEGQEIPRVGIRNTIRFQWVVVGEEMMPRDVFARLMLLGVLKLRVEDVFCLQTNMTQVAYEVTLSTAALFASTWEKCIKVKDERLCKNFRIMSLDRPNFRLMSVHTYNPYVTDLAIAQFLENYAEVVSAARYVKDPLGFWTGRRQYQVLLKPDKRSKDGMAHPPALFQLGADRGYIYYAGQPPFCRRCRGVWHTETECGGRGCRTCGQEGHEARDCTIPKACHGCGERGHLYRNCGKRTRTFAEVVTERGVGHAGVERVEQERREGVGREVDIVDNQGSGKRKKGERSIGSSEEEAERKLLQKDAEGDIETTREGAHLEERGASRVGRKKKNKGRRDWSAGGAGEEEEQGEEQRTETKKVRGEEILESAKKKQEDSLERSEEEERDEGHMGGTRGMDEEGFNEGMDIFSLELTLSSVLELPATEGEEGGSGRGGGQGDFGGAQGLGSYDWAEQGEEDGGGQVLVVREN